MHVDTLNKITAKWPKGCVLSLYLRNGFNTIVTHPDLMELTKHAVHGQDAGGMAFAAPLEEIVYAVVRPDRKRNA